jgi:hypothetical protein
MVCYEKINLKEIDDLIIDSFESAFISFFVEELLLFKPH